MGAKETPSDFCALVLNQPLQAQWIHIIAFTTNTNYIDIESDSALVQKVEDFARKMKIDIVGVPLSINHPFATKPHSVFNFWEKNGYKKAGHISWVASPTEKISCYFYEKRI